MPLFARRNAPVDPNTAAATGTREKRGWPRRHHDNGAPVAEGHHGRRGSRPTFGEWIKGTWLDILTMAAMGAIGLGVYRANPAPSRSFPVAFQDGEVVYPEFAYPMRKEIVPIVAAAVMASLIPILIFVLMQIRVRSFWDLNNSILGLLYSLITAAVFQVFLKWLIGGLRPHFLAVCKPALPAGNVEVGNGYRQIMYDRKICTGDEKEINDSLESFPSGHSTAAFAGFIYLYLYLNAKLKVWSNYHPAMWKLIVTYAPVLGATLIAGALTIDEFHNWYDCLAGAVIGTVFAFSSYRMVYASVWDFRFNHIPLARNEPFAYGAGADPAYSHLSANHAVFTHKANWGSREHGVVGGGAPFDASQAFGAGTGAAGSASGITHGGHHGNHHVERRPVAPAHTHARNGSVV